MLQKQILTTAMLKRWSHEMMRTQPQTGRESVRNCCLTLQFFSYIMARSSLFSMKMM